MTGKKGAKTCRTSSKCEFRLKLIRIPVIEKLMVFLLISALLEARRVLPPSLPFTINDMEIGPSNKSDDNIDFGPGRRLSPEDHKVSSLPGLSSNSMNHFAGHLTVYPSKGNNIFYWLFEAPTNPNDQPLIIWLNGGPGCSSMDGLFLELGPFQIDGEKLKLNPHSWHNAGNLLFIDQPVGTGLSFSKSNTYVKNDDEVNQHLYSFIMEFLKLHSRYVDTKNKKRISRDIFFTGESHAGHYIPSIAAYIKNKNSNLDENKDIFINIKGLAIGNGWIDPYNQYDVSDFAHGMGLITNGQKNKLKRNEKQCRSYLKQGRLSESVCFSLLDDVVAGTGLGSSNKMLIYDSRKFVQNARWFPPGHEQVEKYLNKQDVRRAIHATAASHKYVECADPPYNALSHQDGKGVTEELKTLLDAGMPVLLYSGQFDVICQHLGTERMLQDLDWSGRQGWMDTKVGVWLVDGQPAGYLKAYRNLQSLVVLDSGHMVPMDRPKQALEMIKKFIAGQSLSNGDSRLGVNSQPLDSDCAAVRVSTVPRSDGGGGSSSSSSSGNGQQQQPLSLPAPIIGKQPIPLDGAVILFVNAPSHDIEIDSKSYSLRIVAHSSSGSGLKAVTTAPLLDATAKGVKVEGLANGVHYVFTIHLQDGAGKLSLDTAVVISTPGCYVGGYVQCCGRGRCSSSTSSNPDTVGGGGGILPTSPICHCDEGYSGDRCQDKDTTTGAGAGGTVQCPATAYPFDTGRQVGTGTSTGGGENMRYFVNESISQLCPLDDGLFCDLELELQFGVKSTLSWITSQEFPKYRDSLQTVLCVDISNALQSDEKGRTGSLHNDVASCSLEASWTGEQDSLLSALTAHIQLHGSPNTIQMILSILRDQSSDKYSKLRNGVMSYSIVSVTPLIDKSLGAKGKGSNRENTYIYHDIDAVNFKQDLLYSAFPRYVISISILLCLISIIKLAHIANSFLNGRSRLAGSDVIIKRVIPSSRHRA
eukprot:gene3070-6020_t